MYYVRYQIFGEWLDAYKCDTLIKANCLAYSLELILGVETCVVGF